MQQAGEAVFTRGHHIQKVRPSEPRTVALERPHPIPLGPSRAVEKLHQFLFHPFLFVEIRVFAHLLVKGHIVLHAVKARVQIIAIQRTHIGFIGANFGGDIRSVVAALGNALPQLLVEIAQCGKPWGIALLGITRLQRQRHQHTGQRRPLAGATRHLFGDVIHQQIAVGGDAVHQIVAFLRAAIGQGGGKGHHLAGLEDGGLFTAAATGGQGQRQKR